MQYAVKAIRHMEPVSLTIDASDASQARLRAEQQGCAVLTVQRLATGIAFLRPRKATFPLLQFNQSLLILLEAGLSVVEAVETLADRESRTESQRVLADLYLQMKEGRSYSAALAAQPAVFPPIYVAGVKASETTGEVAEAVRRFIAYRAQADLLRKRVIGAAVYPALIMGVGCLVIAFLLLYVVPRFSVVFQDMGDRVPTMSRLLMAWGRFAQANGWALLFGGIATLLVAAYLLGRPAVRAWLARGLLRVPHVGEHVRVYQLARFYRALGMLQQSGIAIVAALDMVAGLLPRSLQPALEGARRGIGEGRSLSAALEANGLTTVVSLRLLRVAERSGRMGEMLERAAAFHEDDIAQAIDWFIRLFEPLLMIAIGIVVGVVVLLMYAPIFELAGSLQ